VDAIIGEGRIAIEILPAEQFLKALWNSEIV
jgi:hypothetical protein